MKILVLQLARLGDIFMTWPALRAIKRTNPNAEIHLLTRPRFDAAVKGLDVVSKHWSLDTAQILEPLAEDANDIQKSLNRLTDQLTLLKAEKFDQIINLTFSPASSYITHYLSEENTKVLGYTRHSDGFLNFADEVSSYFYSQVGIGRANRVHLSDIFASMLGLEYVAADWAGANIDALSNAAWTLPDNYIVIHVGASEAQKSLPAQNWISFVNYFISRKPNVPLVLIGAPNEKHISEAILASVKSNQIIDLVGKTQVSDLFGIIGNALFLVGCDSAPIHVASLADTPTLNLSIGKVNFWETGPKATHAFIHRAESIEKFIPQRAAEVLAQILEEQIPDDVITRVGGLSSYSVMENDEQSFQWRLCQAIYLGTEFPVSEDLNFYEAVIRLEEVNNLILEQLNAYQTKGQHSNEILDSADEVITSISRLVPDVSPIVYWYQAEKIKIQPGASEDVLSATRGVHQTFNRILQVYLPQDEKTHTSEAMDGTL